MIGEIVETAGDEVGIGEVAQVETGEMIAKETEDLEGAVESPTISKEEITNKTRTEIRELANKKGLKPFGRKDDPDYPRKWKDPVTKKQRLRLDPGHLDDGIPYENQNARIPHAHGYDTNGDPIRDLSGDKHFPLNEPGDGV